MAVSTRLGDIGWIALIASLGFFIGTSNAWSPNHLVSQAQEKPCDPNAKDPEGNNPICPPPTSTPQSPKKSR